MKTIFASLAFLAFIIISCKPAEEKINIPEAVKAKFSSMYPAAAHAEWEMEGGNYEASFKDEKMESSVILSPDGNVVETETSMDASMLPQPIHDYVTAQLAGKKISSAAKVVNATGMVSYEAEVEGTDYLFDSNGQFTGKEEEEKGEEKE